MLLARPQMTSKTDTKTLLVFFSYADFSTDEDTAGGKGRCGGVSSSSNFALNFVDTKFLTWNQFKLLFYKKFGLFRLDSDRKKLLTLSPRTCLVT